MDPSNTFGITPFAGTDFSSWKFRILALLEDKEVEEHAKKVPTAADLESDSWKKSDAKAKNLVVRCIANSHLDYVKDKSTAYEMINSLCAIFERKSLGTKVYLKKKLMFMKCEKDKSLSNFFMEFEAAVRAYKSAGGTVDESELVIFLLIAMPNEYNTVVATLETLEEHDLTMDRVKGRLLEAELKLKSEKTNTDGTADGTPLSFETQVKITCYKCGKLGHKANKCKSKVGKKKFTKQQANSGNTSKSDIGSDKPFAFLTTSRKKTYTNFESVIDSGCTAHIINDDSLLPQSHSLDSPINIGVAKDGESMNAVKGGHMPINLMVNGREKSGVLKDVLYVPSSRQNLISVSKIDRTGGSVVFENGQAKIFMDKKLVGIGELKGGLYYLQMHTSKNIANTTFYRKSELTMLWHRRLGHLGHQNMCKLITKKMVEGIDCKFDDLDFCESCVKAKQTKLPFSNTRIRANRPLGLVHSDVCGPSNVASHDDKRYFCTFIDDFTHMTATYLLKNKSEVTDCFKEYKSMAEAHFGCKVSRLRCDNGGEYRSNEMKSLCKSEGVTLEYTTPHTPELNGVSERMNRTLLERAKSMLIESKAPKELWGEAVLAATYLTNRTPTETVPNKTPYEAWYGHKPDLSKLKVFGCYAYALVPREKRTKLDDNTVTCIMVGYGPNGYRLWNMDTRKLIYSRDVKFDESRFGDVVEVDEEDETEKDAIVRPQTPVKTPLRTQESPKTSPTTVRKSPKKMSDLGTLKKPPESETDEEFATPEATSTEPSHGRMQRIRQIPKRFNDFILDDFEGHLAYHLGDLLDDVPRDFKDVTGRHDEAEWRTAIKEELDSLIENGTWSMVKKPKDVKLIDSRWIFKLKTSEDGERKPKARLVAKGYMQKAGINYFETYSPVARLSTIRLLLAVGIQHGFEISHLDVKTAFLHGHLEESIYLKPPDGVTAPAGCVLKLNRSLYGLKQSPKCWNDCFHEFAVTLGFKRSESDYCLYVLVDDSTVIYLGLYVDDILLCGNNPHSINLVKQRLSNRFRMKDLGVVKTFMGMTISIDNEKGVLAIDQSDYLLRILERFGMKDCNPVSTPMEMNCKLRRNDDANVTKLPYKELLGSLMYLMLCTRPDLCFAVGYLSRYQDNATDEHFAHLKRVLRYLKDTASMKLVYKRSAELPLVGYADSDWANDLDDRKSTSGFLFQVYGNTVMWCSKKQPIVTCSTTEAEYVSAATAAMEASWFIKVLSDLQIDPMLPVKIYEDNQGCIYVSRNPETKRSKHIDVKFHYLRECVWNKRIALVGIPSRQQVADCLTKSLGKELFLSCRTKLGLERGEVSKMVQRRSIAPPPLYTASAP